MTVATVWALRSNLWVRQGYTSLPPGSPGLPPSLTLTPSITLTTKADPAP